MNHRFLLVFVFSLVLGSFLQAQNHEPGLGLEFFSADLTEPLEKRASAESTPLENVELLGGGAFGKDSREQNEETAENEEAGDEEILELNTIQDFWNLYEVSQSFRERYVDGEDWTPDEENLFFFYHLQEHIRLERLEEWAKPEIALEELDSMQNPELNKHRFDAFWIYGKLLSVEKVELEEDVIFRYNIPFYYVCHLELEEGRKVTLFCQKLPRALLKPGVLESKPSVGIIALFLKKGEKNGNIQVDNPEKPGEKKELASMFMLGQRLAWFPDTLLGNAGMDVGLFDDLDREELPENALRSASSDMRLSLYNRECFYQMMNTVFRMPAESLKKIVEDVQKNAPEEHFEQINYVHQETKDGKKPPRYSSVVPLFNQPAKEHGNFFYLKGIARRIVPIRVEDSDINKRFGITHYYEIFMFPDETPESPIVVLVPELPPEIQPGNSMGFYAELTVPAFFFNTWAYQKGTTEDGKQIRHLSPLFIGGIPAPTVSTVFTPDLKWFYVIGTAVFSLLFIGSTVLYFMGVRSEEESLRNRQKMYALPEGTRFENEVKPDPENREIGFEEWVQKNQ